MKKLIILVSLIALLASGMAFAQVTISGQIQYEVAESFDKDIDDKALTLKDPDTQAILNIKADDFTSGWIRLRQRKEAVIGIDNPARWVDYDRAYFTTNFLPAFGVKDAPVDLRGTFGLNEYTPAFVANVEWDIVKKFATKTKLDNNKTKIDFGSYGNKKIEKWGMMPKISIMKMVDVAAAFSLESETLKDFFTDLVVGAPVGPGTLKGEFAYGISNTKEFDKGWMQFALAYAMKMGDIGLNFGAGYNMELNDDKNANAISGYGVGVKATYGTLAYGFLGLQGYMKNSDIQAKYDGELLHHVRIGVGARPVNAFGLDAGVILYTGGEESVGKDSRTFNTLDVSGVVYVGKANFRLGYLYTPKNDPSIDPWKTDATKRSLYFIATLAY
jgi:hypothetical protein